ncbi:transcription elongation factor S-II protein [Opisthorchis viverrini]|uniref:Transcription elongation factor S-II protein n=1 Tax=Opisthorchis viverrini TaxID=6198 RepID=A0A1S8WKM8_OPIVI|nr:transcription elongation factor S-II protein [Opisthorchis viverrini]
MRPKLHVLGTLNEVTLTLSELSESGVGRAVSKLKSSPGELGSTARLLVTKWKRLLREHLAKESVQLPQDITEVEVTADNHTSLSAQCQTWTDQILFDLPIAVKLLDLDSGVLSFSKQLVPEIQYFGLGTATSGAS